MVSKSLLSFFLLNAKVLAKPFRTTSLFLSSMLRSPDFSIPETSSVFMIGFRARA